MKNMIERYVYDVTRRLPENQRADVEKELTANINDMLGEKPSDKEIEDVLVSLGHPRKLANSYRENQRYLIGPEWMDDYWMVLKIVLIVFAILGLIGGLTSGLTNPEATGAVGIIAEVLAKSISSVFNAMLEGFAIVTVIFYLIERSNKKREDSFQVSKLPDLPKEKSHAISKSGAVTSLIFESIFGVLFIYLLATGQFNLIWFDDNFQISNQYAIFNQSIVDTYIPIFIVCLAATLFADILRLLKSRWDLQLFAVHAFAKVLGAIVTVVFLTTSGLLNTELFSYLADLTGISQSSWIDGVMTGFIVISVLAIIGTLIDLAKIFFTKLNLGTK